MFGYVQALRPATETSPNSWIKRLERRSGLCRTQRPGFEPRSMYQLAPLFC